MRYVLFVSGRAFVSVSTYGTYDAARAAYETAVAKVAFGLCAGDSVVLMTRHGRIISQMY